MKHKILIISAYFYPEQFKSTDIALNLKKNGADVTVLTGLPNYPEGKIYKNYSNFKDVGIRDFKDIKIFRVPTFPRGRKALNLGINYLSMLFFYGFFSLFYLRFKNFNKIIFIGFSPGLLAYVNIFFKNIFTDSPSSTLWLQDFWPDDLVSTGFFKSKSIFVKSNRWLMKYIYSSYTELAATSYGMASELRNRTNRKVKCIFNPIEEELFVKMNEAPLKKKFNEGKIKIMFAGNVSGNQNIDSILEAFNNEKVRKRSEIHFFTHGARQIENVKKMSDLYPSSIIFRGSLDIKDLYKESRCFDFGIVSLSDYTNLKDILPSRVQTMLSMGLPLISFGTPELAKIVLENKNGIIIDGYDHKSLEDSIIIASNFDNNQKLQFSRNSIELSKKIFSPNFIAYQFLEDL